MATLSDVAKTGRGFRRIGETEWCWLDGRVIRNGKTPNAGHRAIDAEMLIANDWEAEPLTLELNAQDIFLAARQLNDLVSKRRLSAAEFAKYLCLELGLVEEA